MTTLPAVFDYKWNDRIALDLALLLEGSGETMNELLARHKLTVQDMVELKTDKSFLKRVEELQRDVREKGLTFKLKAKVQAEELLNTSWTLIHSHDVSPAVKADLIKSTVRWAGLETPDPKDSLSAGTGVAITINFGSQAVPVKLIDAEVSEVKPSGALDGPE